METIISKNGNQTWNIISKESRPAKNRNRTYFIVACSKCGHNIDGEKSNIQARPKCPGCTPKPPALKTDDEGNCITICRLGQLEYIHNLITEEGMSERDATKTFIEVVKAHTPTGDPLTEDLTVDKVRSQFRRDTGKLNGKPKVTSKPRVGSTQIKEKDHPPEISHTMENGVVCDANRCADMAIEILECITEDEPQRVEALQRVASWITCNQKV